MKKYLANTPLILQDGNGEDVRVERGATVMLSPTQYAEVAAHVTPVDVAEEAENGRPENPSASATVEAEKNETAEKPNKRGGRTKESAA